MKLTKCWKRASVLNLHFMLMHNSTNFSKFPANYTNDNSLTVLEKVIIFIIKYNLMQIIKNHQYKKDSAIQPLLK